MESSFDELGSFYNGLSGKSKDDFGQGSDRFITYMNVYKNTTATPDGCELVLVEDGEHQNRVEYGDILFTQSSETLEEVGLSSVWLHKASPFLNSFCFGFHFAEKEMINPRFIAYSLRTSYMREKIIREGQGATRYNLSSNRLKPIKLVYPSYQEQSRIASLMSRLETRIEKQQELICTLKKYKRGVVSSILTHQIKFADSEGKPYPEWTYCTLQDAVVFLDGQRNPLESADRAKRQGQYPYYGASGIIDYIDDYIFDEPLLLLGEDGANILNRSTPLCFIATGKYWVNNHAHVMRPKSGQNLKFLCELLESLDYTRYNTGTAQPKINQEKCREIEISLPVYEEQCRIASFLTTLDRRLKSSKSNLNYLLSIRDGLLQQLFI